MMDISVEILTIFKHFKLGFNAAEAPCKIWEVGKNETILPKGGLSNLIQ